VPVSAPAAATWAQASEVAIAVDGEDVSLRTAHHLHALMPGEVDSIALTRRHLPPADCVDVGAANVDDASMIQRRRDSGGPEPARAHAIGGVRGQHPPECDG